MIKTSKHTTQFFKSPAWVLLLVVFAAACSRPVIKLENIPENTPPGSGIFVAGNFNRWDPGDERFRLEMDTDSNYYFTMPRGFGKMEFKITRGEWSSVETDICGYDINNRSYGYTDQDTLTVDVLSWKDLEPINCPELTIVVENLPENTPDDEPIALAGNFNEWSPDSSSFLQRDSQSGKYMIKLPRVGLERLLEFKVTRGNLLTAEADKYGFEIEKRQIMFGLTDTLFIDVENWEDIVDVPQNSVTIILDEIPAETPENDGIYLTGSFNGWYPKDPKYRFELNEKGKYQYTLPRKADFIEFKVTRGDWSKEEVDLLGYKMGNRKFEFGSADTLFLTIHGWLDQTTIKQPSYTFLVEELPSNTPANAELYLAGSINGWNSGKRKHRFKINNQGKYYLTLNDAVRSLEYKITRGDWDNQEVDENGNIIQNRYFEYNGEDTIKIRIANWLDKPAFRQKEVVIFLESVPKNTPSDRHIYITGTFNNWNPGSPNYILNKNLKGNYYITIPAKDDYIEFKFTLGSWEYEELNKDGHTISNRRYNFGYTDTLRLSVDRWEIYGR
jgi:hypothetical protein